MTTLSESSICEKMSIRRLRRRIRLVVEAPGVLSNDWDNVDDELTAVLDTAPMYGYLEYLNSDGSFSYLPGSGFFGTDEFYYRASDGIDESEQPAKVSIKVVDMDLKSVTFHGSHVITSDPDADGQTIQYVGPHWEVDDEEGERSWPVAYRRSTDTFGSLMAVSAEFNFSPSFCALCGSGEILVRAFGPDGIEVPARTVELYGDYAVLPETWVETPFPGEVRHYDKFVLNWQASSDAEETWIDVGASQNDVYLTFDTPAPAPLYHTVVHIGSHNAQGIGGTGGAPVVEAIWDYFSNSDGDVTRVDGNGLSYYRLPAEDPEFLAPVIGDLPSLAREQVVGDTAGLLRWRDGACGAWADFFQDVLLAHGISAPQRQLWILEWPEEVESGAARTVSWLRRGSIMP